MALERLPVNAFRICIDRLDSDIAGSAYSPLREEAISFDGYSKLLLQMDAEFDQVGYPESFQEKRSFSGGSSSKEVRFHGIPTAVLSDEEVRSHVGSVATVEVMVRMRRNASWQGDLFGVDSDWHETFRSEVDLLNKIILNCQ